MYVPYSTRCRIEPNFLKNPSSSLEVDYFEIHLIKVIGLIAVVVVVRLSVGMLKLVLSAATWHRTEMQ